jgi:hypothetical protein
VPARRTLVRVPASWSDLGHPAVDEELDARDVATFVGSKKGDRFGNFIQGSRATKRYFAHDTVHILLDLFVGPA